MNDRVAPCAPLDSRAAQQSGQSTQQTAQQQRNSAAEPPSVLEMARNITRNGRATRHQNPRNNRPTETHDVLRKGPAMPEVQDIAPICREACEGLNLYWADLARWLIRQGDPGWCVPDAVRWWARLVDKRGWPRP